MPNRREFLAALVATSLAAAAEKSALPALTSVKHRSLVPDEPSRTPAYWCTWAVQNYMYGQGKPDLDPSVLEGSSGSSLAHSAMTERALLGSSGWATCFYPRVRGDLYLMLDDGWESGGTATFELDRGKFASYKGSSAQRLRALNRDIMRRGWRGVALWCRNTPGGVADIRLERESVDAGIGYWKIDIGDPNFNLVRTRDQEKLSLTLEHVHGELPVNGEWKKDGRFGSQSWGTRRMEILRNTDVYRTYDVTSALSLPTTLDRVSEMLLGASGHSDIQSLLNVEDEVYVAAVLGCTMGVMRHPLHGLRPMDDADLFFNGSRETKQRMDEIVRALRWQRIAAPFSCGLGSFRVSDEILLDGWTFSAGQSWQHDLLGQTVWQSAPAVMARNIDLPEVEVSGDKPYVFAARFPNGAVAIGAQERTQPGRAWRMPLARVALNMADAPGPLGVFGEYGELRLTFSKAQSGKRVIAQDLAGAVPVDITAFVRFDGVNVLIEGSALRNAGLRSRTPGDLSSPAAVVAFI